jgi:hypothetical protein
MGQSVFNRLTNFQVLIAFVATALTTFLVLIAGYLTYSLPDNCATRTDSFVIAALRRAAGLKQGAEALYSRKRSYRVNALRDFMLILSDQQLVTGLAMLVAAFARYPSITVYFINVVMTLVFFSFTVHLATLDIITSELRRNKLLKEIRVVLMFITLLFLVLVLILQLSSTWTVRSRQSDLFLIYALPYLHII